MFRLKDASIILNSTPFLALGDLSIGPGVHAFVGPSAVGKSLLLHTLFDIELPEGVMLRGEWTFNDARVPDLSTRAKLARSVVFFHQNPGTAAVPLATAEAAKELLDKLASPDPKLWALDEPERSFAIEDRTALLEALRTRAQPSIVLLISHDVEFIRAASDYVHLIADGRLMASSATEAFFEAPPNELAAQFVRTGNCSPPQRQPDLPSHFKWIIPGKLAGMGQPGLLRDAEEDLTAIALAGIKRLVSLTNHPEPADRLEAFGIQGAHWPIRDMCAPTPEAMASLCEAVWSWIDEGVPVAVHCRAGLGRTGLTLASLLIYRGASAEEGLRTARAIEPHYVQSEEQELFLGTFAGSLAAKR